MPINFEKKLSDGSHLVLWQIDEEEAFFLSKLSFEKDGLDELNRFKAPHRRLEWLTVRLLLRSMLGESAKIVYDEYGRPALQGCSGYISISHSKKVAGIYFHPEKRPGLDIEIISEKVEKVKHKFLSPEELEKIGEKDYTEKLVLYWCAKECLLKIVGRKDIDFIEQLKIQPFDYSIQEGLSTEINYSNLRSWHTLNYFRHHEYILVYGS